MLNLKNQRGSITLFVLVSCLFFLASVSGIQIYMQSKQVAVDREYRQIKSNYESAMEDNANLDETYYKLSQLENPNLSIEKATLQNGQLLVDLRWNKITNLDIKTIKYGWGTSSSIDSVSSWNYIESESANDKIIVINNQATTSGDYHLFLVVNDKEIYRKITV